MNIKNLIFTLILLAGSSISAMNPAPGTVIDPLKHTGQFTVTMAESSVASIPSGLPLIAQASSHASATLFKNKGMPVIITTVAGMAPWWALTTGTGYLMISQCGISDPTLLVAMAAGASYAAGEQTNSMVKKCINNPYFQSATQVALCAACVGLSYAGSTPLINTALFATAQAIGLQTMIEASSKLVAQNQSPATPSNSWMFLSPETKAGIMDGTINALSTILPSLCTTDLCDPYAMLRIL
jgi:hypothetical protein